MPRHVLLSALVSLSILLSALTTAHAASYTFTTLDGPNASRTLAFGLNNSGQIVGFYEDSSGQHGFLYVDGMFTTLADFPGAVGRTVAFGLNNSGQIVGSYSFQSGGGHGFLYDQGIFTSLDVPFPGASDTVAFGINDVGQIVGIYGDSSGQHGFLYDQGVFTPLDVPGAATGTTRAFGLNNSGQIVGTYSAQSVDNGLRDHGFLYVDGVFTSLPDVPFSSAFNTTAQGINNGGQILGYYVDQSGQHGFLYSAGVFTPLDVPGVIATIYAFDINDVGQIVGFYTDSSGGTHGFVATPQVIIVTIDIQPGSEPATINPKSQGVIPVAILTTDTFDATTVNAATIRFGKTGTEAAIVRSALEDVDGDGDTDLLLNFNTQDTGIQCGDTSASLTGETSDGQPIQGSDAIVTTGCKK